jgi:hypothetical protein
MICLIQCVAGKKQRFYLFYPIIAKILIVGAASSPRIAPGSFRVLLTPLTYIHVGDDAPTESFCPGASFPLWMEAS